MNFDVIVIGAGVTGSFIARELRAYELSVCVLDRSYDAATGASAANSGIVHAGFDAAAGTNKAKFNVLGNGMMERVCRDLHVPFQHVSSLVVAFDEADMATIRTLYENGLKNGVQGLEIIDRDALRALEPHIAPEAIGALHAPTGAIVCPYELTFGALESAVINGAQYRFNTEVTGVERKDGLFHLRTSTGEYTCRYLIDAAGVGADAIAALCGDGFFRITPRKGEYMLMDKRVGKTVSHVIFQTPKNHTKGILVSPTVDGNLFVGPNANYVDDKADTATTPDGLAEVLAGGRRSVPMIDPRYTITSFAGLRATGSTGDFIIGFSDKVENLYYAAAIESPGLTSAPAIGAHAAAEIAAAAKAEKRAQFDPIRPRTPVLHELPEEELAAMVGKNPAYGRIVCRCEKISEGEIVDAIHRAVPATTLDGVKRRTRAGMGRCQGGFCGPKITDILAAELGMDVWQITKSGPGSEILIGKTKTGTAREER